MKVSGIRLVSFFGQNEDILNLMWQVPVVKRVDLWPGFDLDANQTGALKGGARHTWRNKDHLCGGNH